MSGVRNAASETCTWKNATGFVWLPSPMELWQMPQFVPVGSKPGRLIPGALRELKRAWPRAMDCRLSEVASVPDELAHESKRLKITDVKGPSPNALPPVGGTVFVERFVTPPVAPPLVSRPAAESRR